MINKLFKTLLRSMAKITINDTVVSGSSSSLVVKNGKVFVDGKEVTPDGKTINIKVEGDLGSLRCDACENVDVNGSVGGNAESVSGNITVTGKVDGKVSTTSGDVKCGDVGKGVSTVSGDVSCGAVAGKVETLSGDIKHWA